MKSTQKKKCPICGTEYVKNQQKCRKCLWNLSIYSDDKNYSIKEITTINENWAKNAYIICRKAKNYYQDNKKLRKTMDDYTKEILLLKKQVTELQNQVHQILISQANESEDLKNEIIAEIKQLIKPLLKSHELNQQQNNIPRQSKRTPPSSENIDSSLTTHYLELDQYEPYIINEYSHNPNFLTEYAYKVTPTKKSLEDIYLNRATAIVFQESNQSDYWIVELKDIGYYLLPDLSLRINTNSKTVKTIFELKNYQEIYHNFKVIKPAKVYNCGHKEWQLLTKGILQFE